MKQHFFLFLYAFQFLSFSAWAEQDTSRLLHEPIQPLQAIQVDVAKALLGERLFHEKRLSANNSMSCASCHNLQDGGADHEQFSLGIKERLGHINTPTIFNAALNIAQFWDGRAQTLEGQIDGPIHDHHEMDSNWSDILAKLSQDKYYPVDFKKLYQQPMGQQTIKHAIAEFERSQITVNSRFDQYLLGNPLAITEAEKKGYAIFKRVGCVSCHQGRNVGGNMFQTLGVMEDYFSSRGNISEVDFGRFNVTGKESDKFKFKVPSLRLVTLTAPYFHDGNIQTLEEAVGVMARMQLGRELTEEDIGYIISFLHSLVSNPPKLIAK